ncbi:MAG: hypothetical protein Q7K40_02740 [bacterium]|nr:hypothetical protein [bacterium]
MYDQQNNTLFEKGSDCLYKIKKGSAREKIVSALCMNKGFVPTNLLAKFAEKPNTKLTISEIQKISLLFKKKFDTDKELFKGEAGSGYRINPEIRVVNV